MKEEFWSSIYIDAMFFIRLSSDDAMMPGVFKLQSSIRC